MTFSMLGGVGGLSENLYPGKLSFKTKGESSFLPPPLLPSSLPFSVFSLTFRGMLTIIWWGGAVNMSLQQRKETLKIPELLQDDGASELLAFR